MRDVARADAVTAPVSTMQVGRFEQLPKWLNLIPMIAQWLWLSLRYRSVSLPSCANPGITSGGMVGDGKLEYFAAMGAIGHAATAPHVGIANVDGLAPDTIAQRMHQVGLAFPVVAKPDIGWCGYGVCLLRTQAELAAYVHAFPRNEAFVLQRYLPEAGEAGLFYVREPDAPRGRLIGILLRHYPSVTGNGIDDVGTLVARDPRLRRAAADPMHASRQDPAYVPADGETVRVSTVASTRVGGRYEDGSHHATDALVGRVDAIAQDMGTFLVGRFDVRYATIEALQRGEFTIMEVNGAGSEAVHAWDPKYTIRDVYRIVFAKQRLLFAISDANRRRGHAPIGWWRLARLHLRQQRTMAGYPPSN